MTTSVTTDASSREKGNRDVLALDELQLFKQAKDSLKLLSDEISACCHMSESIRLFEMFRIQHHATVRNLWQTILCIDFPKRDLEETATSSPRDSPTRPLTKRIITEVPKPRVEFDSCSHFSRRATEGGTSSPSWDTGLLSCRRALSGEESPGSITVTIHKSRSLGDVRRQNNFNSRNQQLSGRLRKYVYSLEEDPSYIRDLGKGEDFPESVDRQNLLIKDKVSELKTGLERVLHELTDVSNGDTIFSNLVKVELVLGKKMLKRTHKIFSRAKANFEKQSKLLMTLLGGLQPQAEGGDEDTNCTMGIAQKAVVRKSCLLLVKAYQHIQWVECIVKRCITAIMLCTITAVVKLLKEAVFENVKSMCGVHYETMRFYTRAIPAILRKEASIKGPPTAAVAAAAAANKNHYPEQAQPTKDAYSLSNSPISRTICPAQIKPLVTKVKQELKGNEILARKLNELRTAFQNQVNTFLNLNNKWKMGKRIESEKVVSLLMSELGSLSHTIASVWLKCVEATNLVPLLSAHSDMLKGNAAASRIELKEILNWMVETSNSNVVNAASPLKFPFIKRSSKNMQDNNIEDTTRLKSVVLNNQSLQTNIIVENKITTMSDRIISDRASSMDALCATLKKTILMFQRESEHLMDNCDALIKKSCNFDSNEFIRHFLENCLIQRGEEEGAQIKCLELCNTISESVCIEETWEVNKIVAEVANQVKVLYSSAEARRRSKCKNFVDFYVKPLIPHVAIDGLEWLIKEDAHSMNSTSGSLSAHVRGYISGSDIDLMRMMHLQPGDEVSIVLTSEWVNEILIRPSSLISKKKKSPKHDSLMLIDRNALLMRPKREQGGEILGDADSKEFDDQIGLILECVSEVKAIGRKLSGDMVFERIFEFIQSTKLVECGTKAKVTPGVSRKLARTSPNSLNSEVEVELTRTTTTEASVPEILDKQDAASIDDDLVKSDSEMTESSYSILCSSSLGKKGGLNKRLSLKSMKTLEEIRTTKRIPASLDEEFLARFFIDAHVLTTYTCALKGALLLQGKMYVTEDGYLGFHSIFNQTTLFSPYPTTLCFSLRTDVTAIRRRVHAFIFPNAIEFELKNGQSYFFTSFLRREQAWEQILQVSNLRLDIEGVISSRSLSLKESAVASEESRTHTSELPNSEGDELAVGNKVSECLKMQATGKRSSLPSKIEVISESSDKESYTKGKSCEFSKRYISATESLSFPSGSLPHCSFVAEISIGDQQNSVLDVILLLLTRNIKTRMNKRSPLEIRDFKMDDWKPELFEEGGDSEEPRSEDEIIQSIKAAGQWPAREASYLRKIDAGPLGALARVPDFGGVSEKHTCYLGKKRDGGGGAIECAVLETLCKFSHIPFCDSFNVLSRLIVTTPDNTQEATRGTSNRIRLDLEAQVIWTGSCWLKGKVETAAYDQIFRSRSQLIESIKEISVDLAKTSQETSNPSVIPTTEGKSANVVEGAAKPEESEHQLEPQPAMPTEVHEPIEAAPRQSILKRASKSIGTGAMAIIRRMSLTDWIVIALLWVALRISNKSAQLSDSHQKQLQYYVASLQAELQQVKEELRLLRTPMKNCLE